MRTKTIARFRRAALSGIAAVALPLFAQTAQEAPKGPGENAPQQAPPPGESAPPRPPENAPQRPQPPGDLQMPAPVPGTPNEYTIQKGDTLWDLSQKFLANPW